MDRGLGVEILKLRKDGLSYDEITKRLNCNKAIVSYHCTKNNINDIGLGGNKKLDDNEYIQLKEYYKTHTIKETAKYFNVSISTVKRYVDNKRQILTDNQRKIKNYERVKSYRQKQKQRAVDYKGGKCCKCGYNKSIWSLEFHHTDPNEKDFNISNHSNKNWNILKVELDKCILVCKNCHGEIHEEEYNRRVSPLPDKQLKE